MMSALVPVADPIYKIGRVNSGKLQLELTGTSVGKWLRGSPAKRLSKDTHMQDPQTSVACMTAWLVRPLSARASTDRACYLADTGEDALAAELGALSSHAARQLLYGSYM